MSEYIEIKVKKKYIIIFSVILVFVCSIVGYYTWCSYHPDVRILISDGGTGKEGIKIEAPHISVAGVGIAEPVASIELKLNNIVMQHEFFCTYIKDTYKTADIKLDMEVKDKETILKYDGTATTLDGKTIDIKKEIVCDYVIDANIVDKS